MAGLLITPLILFLLGSMIWPSTIKHRSSFFLGFMILVVSLLIMLLAEIIGEGKTYQVFSTIAFALEIVVLVLFVMGTSGMSMNQLSNEMQSAAKSVVPTPTAPAYAPPPQEYAAPPMPAHDPNNPPPAV